MGKKMLNHYKKRWTNYTTGHNTLCWSSILNNEVNVKMEKFGSQQFLQYGWKQTQIVASKKFLESFLKEHHQLQSLES